MFWYLKAFRVTLNFGPGKNFFYTKKNIFLLFYPNKKLVVVLVFSLFWRTKVICYRWQYSTLITCSTHIIRPEWMTSGWWFSVCSKPVFVTDFPPPPHSTRDARVFLILNLLNKLAPLFEAFYLLEMTKS